MTPQAYPTTPIDPMHPRPRGVQEVRQPEAVTCYNPAALRSGLTVWGSYSENDGRFLRLVVEGIDDNGRPIRLQLDPREVATLTGIAAGVLDEEMAMTTTAINPHQTLKAAYAALPDFEVSEGDTRVIDYRIALAYRDRLTGGGVMAQMSEASFRKYIAVLESLREEAQ